MRKKKKSYFWLQLAFDLPQAAPLLIKLHTQLRSVGTPRWRAEGMEDTGLENGKWVCEPAGFMTHCLIQSGLRPVIPAGTVQYWLSACSMLLLQRRGICLFQGLWLVSRNFACAVISLLELAQVYPARVQSTSSASARIAERDYTPAAYFY